jgi:AcrR family transcriptional regulator
MSIHESTKVNRRKLLAKTTRKNIKEAALKLFEEYGFDIVTIEDITKEANVSKGAFYVYYSSKEEILINEYKKIDEYYEEVIGAISEDTPVLEQIRIVSAGVFDFCEQIGLHIIRVMYINQISLKANKNEDPNQKFLTDKNRIHYKKLKEICKRGVREKVFKDGLTADEIIIALSHAYHGVLYDWCLYEAGFNMSSEGAKHIDFVLDGLVRKG